MTGIISAPGNLIQPDGVGGAVIFASAIRPTRIDARRMQKKLNPPPCRRFRAKPLKSSHNIRYLRLESPAKTVIFA